VLVGARYKGVWVCLAYRRVTRRETQERLLDERGWFLARDPRGLQGGAPWARMIKPFSRFVTCETGPLGI